MAVPAPFTTHSRRALVGPSRRALAVGVLLVALCAGAGLVRAHRVATAHGRVSADEKAYLRLAHDLQAYGNWGDGGLKQPFRWAPGAPALFAATAGVSGQPVDRDTAFAAQAVIGVLLVPAAFALGALLAGAAAGLVAAAAAAFYQPLIMATGVAGTEPLGALMIVLAGVALVLAWRRSTPLAWAAAGLMLGAATLVRGDLVLAALALPVVVAVVTARGAGVRRGLVAGAAMLAGALVALAPWSAFASSHVHHFVPVTDGGPANLYIGTDLPAGGTLFGVKAQWGAATRRAHPGLRHVDSFKLPEQLVLDTVAARHHGKTRDQALRAAAIDNLRRYALGRPTAFAGMEARKLWRMWSRPYAGTARARPPAARWEHGVLVTLGLLGLIAGVAFARDARLVLLGALILLATAVDVAFVSEPRHVARLLPLLVATGAAGWALAMPRALRWVRRDGSGHRQQARPA